MANNRMYLHNTRTGVKLLLMKYLPSTGWYLYATPDTVQVAMLAVDQADLVAAAGGGNSEAPYETNVGDTAWVVEYEDRGDVQDPDGMTGTPSKN